MNRKTLTDVDAHSARFRLTISVYRTRIRVQNKQWKICPKERFRILKISQEYTAPQAKLPVRIFTLTDNAFAVPVKSGKNITSQMRIPIITSVSTAEQPDLSLAGSAGSFLFTLYFLYCYRFFKAFLRF
jgi:hypothetical protein